MNRKPVIILSALILAALLAWNILTTPKNMDNIPSFAVMEQQGHDWSETRLKGYHIDQLRYIWGEPDGSLHGVRGDVWFSDSGTRITVFYDQNGNADHLKMDEKATAP